MITYWQEKHEILSKILLLINNVYSIKILKMLDCIDAEKRYKVMKDNCIEEEKEGIYDQILKLK